MGAGRNILVVADVSAEQVLGGAERMLVHHLRALQQAGYGVTLLTRQPRPGAPELFLLENGVEEHRLNWDGQRSWRGLRQLKAAARGWWREHEGSFDLLLAEQPFTVWALMQAGCRLPRLQVCHSFAFEEYATRHGVDGGLRHRITAAAMRRLEQRIYDSASRLLVLSDFMRRRLEAFFRIPPSRVSVVPGGVDMPETPELTREQLRSLLGWQGQVAVTLRNLVPRTGVDLLVEAAGFLKDELPQLHWCVIGQGPMLEQLKAQAVALGVAGCVEFCGFLPEDGVRKRLFAADLFVLPTRDLEGFGLVTIEANSCGLPVVATPVSANSEVVPSLPFNRLADAVSGEALAAAVRATLTALTVAPMDDAGRRQLQQAALAKYAWRHHDAGLIAAIGRLK